MKHSARRNRSLIAFLSPSGFSGLGCDFPALFLGHGDQTAFAANSTPFAAHIRRILETFLTFQESEQSKIFPNEAFGYWKITVERPLRLKVELSPERLKHFRLACAEASETPLVNFLDQVAGELGAGPHTDFNLFSEKFEALASAHDFKLSAKRRKLIQSALAVRDEDAAPVIKKLHKPGKAQADPLHGRYEVTVQGKQHIAEYEPDSDLRDTEQVPLLEEGGIEAFVRREVLPHVPHAWVDPDATKIGYTLRLSEQNGYASPWNILQVARMGQSDFRTSNMRVQGIASIAKLMPRDLERLGFKCPADMPKWASLLGHPVLPQEIDILNPSICPQCIATTGFLEAHWHLRIMVACPEHLRPAISCCPTCKRKLTWFRPGLLECRCGANLVHQPSTTMEPQDLSILELIRRKVLSIGYTESSCATKSGSQTCSYTPTESVCRSTPGGTMSEFLLARHPRAYSDEGMLGYLLRLTEVNGYPSPARIRSLAGIGSYQSLRDKATLDRLANLTRFSGASTLELNGREELGCTILDDPIDATFAPGGESTLIARLCPLCVKEMGYIQAHWELALMTACPRHQCLGLSICPVCTRQLHWDRPAVLTCECGASLEYKSQGQVTAAEIELCDLLHRKALRLPFPDISASGLPIRHLGSMTLRQFQSLLMALAVCGGLQDKNESQLVVRIAAKLLADWPHGFLDLLDSQYEPLARISHRQVVESG